MNTINDNQDQGNACAQCGTGKCRGKYWKRKAAKGFFILSISGSLLLLALFASELKHYQYIGRDIPSQTTIAVSGEGEAYQVPDVAEISFAITHDAKTPTEARTNVDDKMKAIKDDLLKSGVEEKDIRTTSYTLYPKYEYQKSLACDGTSLDGFCQGKQALVGYTVTQWVDVKIRKIDDAGAVVGGLADLGATNLSNLNFTVENDDAVKAKARKEAIEKAKTKADVLAKDLGVRLVRIVSFNEYGDYPIYSGRGGDMMAEKSAPVPGPATLPAGENKFTSTVNIVYEIK